MQGDILSTAGEHMLLGSQLAKAITIAMKQIVYLIGSLCSVHSLIIFLHIYSPVGTGPERELSWTSRDVRFRLPSDSGMLPVKLLQQISSTAEGINTNTTYDEKDVHLRQQEDDNTTN